MKKALLLFVTLFLMLSVTGLWAAGQQEGEEAAAEEGPAYVREDTIVVDILTGRNSNPGNFNCWMPGIMPDIGLQQLAYRPLWMAEYVQGKNLNVLASEAPIYNSDFTTMTVNLREGLYWSDGVEFTADDLVYTVNTLINNPSFTYGSELASDVKNIRKANDYQVVFELEKSNSRFHTVFVDRWGGIRMMPKHVFEKQADPTKFAHNPPVTLGAYTLKDYDPTGYWFLWEKREDWDRTPVGVLYGEPKPKWVLFHYYGPPEKKVMAQAKHDLDICDLTPETLRASFEKNDYTRGYRKNFPWMVNVDPCITGCMFNTDVEPYDKLDVRWALTLAIDMVSFNSTAFDGTGTVGPLLIPPTPVYADWYIEPMQNWLKNFTLDINVDGQPYKPYDPTIPMKIADQARDRGYTVPSNEQEIRDIWGYGWWKFSPEVAAQLLQRNGFTKKDGSWMLPDGKKWTITITTGANAAHPQYRNAFALAQEWRKFGIDVQVETTEQHGTITQSGNFEISTSWPAAAPFGSHPDLYRVLRAWYSDFYRPIGENAVWSNGGASRWNSNELDQVIDELKEVGWSETDEIIDLGIEGLKVTIEAMPGIPTVAYPGVVSWDTYYWEGYAGADNPVTQPYHHWPNFGFMLPFLEKTGRTE